MKWRMTQKLVETSRSMTNPVRIENQSSIVLSLSVICARFIALQRSSIGSAISVTVEKFVESFVVISLGLKGATVDCQRELLLGAGSAAVGKVVSAFEKGLNVGVVVFHTLIIGRFGSEGKGVNRPV